MNQIPFTEARTMTGGQIGTLVRYIRQLVGSAQAGDRTDGQLLEAFASRQDPAAFAALVGRHAPLVWSACRRLLPDEHAAEDVFQATFLVLVRRAGSVERRGSLGNWLYTVAYHLALKARARAARQRTQEREAADMRPTDLPTDAARWALSSILDEELQELPAKYRQPLVLCYLQGKTNEEAAAELGYPTGSISRHLARGRELLRERLGQRGVALSVGLLIPALTNSVTAAPPAVLNATVQAGLLYAAGKASAGVLSAEAVALAEGLLQASSLAPFKVAAALLLALGLVAGGSVFAYRNGSEAPPAVAAPAGVSRPVVAAVTSEGTDDGLAAAVERRIDDWLPTQAERRMDEIGWATDLRAALRLGKEHGRPIFVFVHSGNMALGRCCGGSSHMRASSLANAQAIKLLNHCYIPVYVSNDDHGKNGPAPADEKAELLRIYQTALKERLPVGSTNVYILTPDGWPLDAMHGCTAASAKVLVDLLERSVRALDIPESEPVIAPLPQSRPPAPAADELVLHLTARYLQRRDSHFVPLQIRLGEPDKSYDWRAYPAEDWLVLRREQWSKLLPAGSARVGTAWPLDQEVTEHVLRHFYPSTEDNDLARNRIDDGALQATLVALTGNRARARLTGSLRMKHSSVPLREDDQFVAAELLGYLDFDLGTRRILALRLYTPGANYNGQPFGVAVRSLP